MTDWGIKDYKELLEKQLLLTIHHAPATMTDDQAECWLEGVKSTAFFALEMLPRESSNED